MPFESSARLFELGQALARLGANGALIVSSGTVTHNLGTFGHFEKPPSWPRITIPGPPTPSPVTILII
jgi:aromatic ring-opening dioxygenase catalytic subunit (LigB family)